ncbi:hypothetical protein KR009_000435, partial [Drosophila setifemur]
LLRSFDEGDTSGLNKLLSRSLKDPILGQHFALPGRTDHSQAIELDTSQSYIAVYTHLKVHATGMPEPLPTPEALEKRYTENLDGKSKINENRIRM